MAGDVILQFLPFPFLFSVQALNSQLQVEPAVGAALLARNHFMKEFEGDHGS